MIPTRVPLLFSGYPFWNPLKPGGWQFPLGKAGHQGPPYMWGGVLPWLPGFSMSFKDPSFFPHLFKNKSPGYENVQETVELKCGNKNRCIRKKTSPGFVVRIHFRWSMASHFQYKSSLGFYTNPALSESCGVQCPFFLKWIMLTDLVHQKTVSILP